MLSKINVLAIIFILILSGCSRKVKNCEFRADLERISESALENAENLLTENLSFLKNIKGKINKQLNDFKKIYKIKNFYIVLFKRYKIN